MHKCTDAIDQWRMSLPSRVERCWVCGWRPHDCTVSVHGRLEIHHIARGCHRANGHGEPANLMLACTACHQDSLDGMPIERQLALKRHYDPTHYDRVQVNLLRRRQPEAVTEAEVDAAWDAWQGLQEHD